jgi:hypothetical protein
LGLTISASLIFLMASRIRVESTPGIGSCFYFTARFPLADGPVTPPSAIMPAQLGLGGANLRPLRILLAEDNPVNRLLAVKLLEKQGMRFRWPRMGKTLWMRSHGAPKSI